MSEPKVERRDERNMSAEEMFSTQSDPSPPGQPQQHVRADCWPAHEM